MGAISCQTLSSGSKRQSDLDAEPKAKDFMLPFTFLSEQQLFLLDCLSAFAKMLLLYEPSGNSPPAKNILFVPVATRPCLLMA